MKHDFLRAIPHFRLRYLLISLIICLTACKSKNAEVPYVFIEAEIIYDSIITRLPGSIYVKDGVFIWQDVFAPDSFLHIIDIENNTEIARYGRIGQGPEEFTTSGVGSCLENGLILYDQNGNFQTYFLVNAFLKGQDPYKPLPYSIKPFCTGVIGIGNDEVVTLCPEENPFLAFEAQNNSFRFGKTPFNKKYTNGYEVNQGHLVYNAKKEILVYAMSGFPYIAIYKKSGTEFLLQHEKSGDLNYTFSNNEVLTDPTKRGIFSIALTKDYIITHQRDYSKDNMDERMVGIDLNKVPGTLFFHSYDGELVKIIDVGMPIIRLNTIYNDNILYAIVANPDYALVSMDVKHLNIPLNPKH